MALKQNVIVDNRAGGNTVIGSELAARAAPDGHTLLVQINNLTALPALAAGKPLTVTVESFAPVTLVAVLPHVLVVPRTVQASSVRELIALAKAAPKKLTYASAGIGTPVHLGGALFASMAGVDLLNVPYKGAADYATAVLGAHVDMTFGSVPTALPHIRTGVLRALGATTAKRIKVLPDLPPSPSQACPDTTSQAGTAYLRQPERRLPSSTCCAPKSRVASRPKPLWTDCRITN